MKSLGRALAFTVFSWLAATALAEHEEVVQDTAPAPKRFSWTGFYAGGNVGGNWPDYQFGSFANRIDIAKQFDDRFPFERLLPTPAFGSVTVHVPESNSTTGSFFGGGQLGYGKQWRQLVLGVEGDFDGLSSSKKVSQPFSSTVTAGSSSAQTHGMATREASTDWNASVRLRAGWAYERWLFYLTAGPAFSELTGRADDTATTDFFNRNFPMGTITSTNNSSKSDTLFGWTGGVGADWRVTELVSVGVEYRYSNFGGHTFVFENHGNAVSSGQTGIEMSSHQATVRINVLLSSLLGK